MMMINTPLTTVNSNNANGLPLAILTPLITLDKGLALVRTKEVRTQVRTKNALSLLVSNTEVSSKVSTRKAFFKWIPKGNNRAKELINHAYQKGRSYLWQATDLLSRIHNEDAFNCHLNGYKVTENGTINLYRNSKSFTNMRKVCIEFSDSIKKELIVFGHVRKALAGLANYLPLRLIFSRQALITQAEKLLFSFLTISSICSISSWGKRTPLVKDLLFLYPVAISSNTFINVVLRHYTINKLNEKALTCICTIFYSVYAPSKYFRSNTTIPRSVPPLSRDLTKPLNEVMIMANRYDSAPVRAEQSKVFKFYNTVTAQVVQTIATTERQAKQQLGNSKLIFVARTPTAKPSINVWGYSYA